MVVGRKLASADVPAFLAARRAEAAANRPRMNTISTATLAKTTFRATLDYGQSTSGTARCPVTDSLGTQVTVDVSVLLANFG